MVFLGRVLSRCLSSSVKRTPLHGLHCELGGKMVPFAGWEMPLVYSGLGTMDSHAWTRQNASLFDVSHMGQMIVSGKDAVKLMETLVPADLQSLPVGSATLTLFLGEDGGILDDTIVSKRPDNMLYVVSNAGTCYDDFARIQRAIQNTPGLDVSASFISDAFALVALQGPMAAEALSRFLEEPQRSAVLDLDFMTGTTATVCGTECLVSRLGYTGEDGYEISIPAESAESVARQLLSHELVEPAGLGARDSLRLEAGLCLNGHDMSPEVTPVEAVLMWTIPKSRRVSGAFVGSDAVLARHKEGPALRRCGFVIEKGAPAREGSEVFFQGKPAGHVTSGLFSPSLRKPIGMAYLSPEASKAGTEVQIQVRSKTVDATIVKMPFVPQRYFRRSSAKE